jgi:hypothetical protein
VLHVILASVRELAEKSITATNPTQKATSSPVFHFLTLTQGKGTVSEIITSKIFDATRTTFDPLSFGTEPLPVSTVL